MGRYRKKPVVVEAVQYEGHGNMVNAEVPPWLWDALESGACRAAADGQSLLIRTLEGQVICAPGDWIIRGVYGELYPCKPAIFAAIYDAEPAREEEG